MTVSAPVKRICPRCSAVLSRYNPDRYCAACAPKAQQDVAPPSHPAVAAPDVRPRVGRRTSHSQVLRYLRDTLQELEIKRDNLAQQVDHFRAVIAYYDEHGWPDDVQATAPTPEAGGEGDQS